MKDIDGHTIRVGDRVLLWDGISGTVVCSLDTGEFDDEFPKSLWGYLHRGIFVKSNEIGLVHYPEAKGGVSVIREIKE